MSRVAEIQKALSGIFPPTRMEVLTGGRKSRKNDWSIVVHPRGDGDLASVLRLAKSENIPLRIGGRTLSGRPPVTPGGAIRVDMTGMDRVISLDEESLLIRVQAGISIAVLKSRLSEKKLMMGWSIYSDRPHTLGAVLAGRVEPRWGARFGPPQDSIRSMTVVLPDGGIVSSPPAPRRAAGPDLGALMVGTSGRLGVISEVTLRVFFWPQYREVMSTDVPVESLERLGQLFRGRHQPYLVEVDVPAEGDAQCIVAFSGAKSAVLSLRGDFVENLGGKWEVEPGLPPREPPEASSVLLTWAAFHRFLEVWKGMKTRRPFSLFDCTATSVRLSGGSPKAIKAALAELPNLKRSSVDKSASYVHGVKSILDSTGILGPMDGQDPVA